MVVERTILPYFEWLIFGPQGFGAIPLFLLLLMILGILAGFFYGASNGTVVLSTLVGTAVGIALAVIVWLVDRRRA